MVRRLALYWWWLQPQRCHPDVWVQASWYLADPLLPSNSVRDSGRKIMQRGRRMAQQCFTVIQSRE